MLTIVGSNRRSFFSFSWFFASRISTYLFIEATTAPTAAPVLPPLAAPESAPETSAIPTYSQSKNVSLAFFPDFSKSGLLRWGNCESYSLSFNVRSATLWCETGNLQTGSSLIVVSTLEQEDNASIPKILAKRKIFFSIVIILRLIMWFHRENPDETVNF